MRNALLLLLIGFVLAACESIDKSIESDSDTGGTSTAEWTWDEVGFSKDSLRTGDLILRHGIGFNSDVFRKMNQRETLYSHAGVLTHNAEGQLMVYHMLGGMENPEYNLRKDPIEKFCDEKHAHRFAIYRYDLAKPVLREMDSLANIFYHANLSFDLLLDLKSDSAMYCSEFVYKLIYLTTGDRNFIPLSEYNQMPYVGVDDLYLNPHTEKILTYEHP